MSQLPVRELSSLRPDGVDVRSAQVRGQEPNRQFEFDPTGDQSIELRVLKGADEATVIGYAPVKTELYIDRRRSGKIDVHEVFPGENRAPLKLTDGVLTLRVLIDRSSVEVFAEDGLVVSTNCVFPRPGSDAVELLAPPATVKRFDAWRRASTRRDE